MECVGVSKQKITVAFSRGELILLSNLINEALEGLEDWDFETRVGQTREQAKELNAQLHQILDEAAPESQR